MPPTLKRTVTQVIAFCLLFSLQSLWANERFESPPVLQARDILSAEMLKGESHQVLPEVRNDGYLNHFTIQSPYGAFPARGEVALVARLQEIYALDVLEKNYPSSKVVSNAALDAGENIVMAPVRGVKKLYETVSDGEKLEDTARSIPGGIVNLFSAAARAVADGATFVYDTGESVVSADSGKASRQYQKAKDTATKAALDFIGYNDTERRLIQELQVDPYSENERLRSEVRRVASIETGTRFGAKFLPGVFAIPYVGVANRYVSHAERIATYEDPEKVEKLSREIANALGLNDDENKDSFHNLMTNEFFTPPLRNALMKNMERLNGVENLALFVEMSAASRSREVARMYVAASDSLADYHELEEKLQALVPKVVVPAGVSRSGELVIPLPVDHLAWTKEVATIFHNFELQLAGYSINRIELRLAGTLTPMAEAQLKKRGATEIKQRLGYS